MAGAPAMSAATGIAGVERARREPRTLLEQYRDDGLLADALGALGRIVRVPPFLLVAAGVAGLLALAASEGAGASDAVVAAGVAWLVLLGGISRGRPHSDRFAWSVPGLLRVGEYGALIWIASNAGGSSSAAAFALIAALAFHHYDIVYRPRFQGVAPPGWLRTAAGGWEGRLVLAVVLLAAGALPGAMFILAGLLGAVFVTECTLSWVRLSTRPVSVYDDEEDEGQ
jgi:predicted outer membrane lipoprotein